MRRITSVLDSSYIGFYIGQSDRRQKILFEFPGPLQPRGLSHHSIFCCVSPAQAWWMDWSTPPSLSSPVQLPLSFLTGRLVTEPNSFILARSLLHAGTCLFLLVTGERSLKTTDTKESRCTATKIKKNLKKNKTALSPLLIDKVSLFVIVLNLERLFWPLSL